MGPGTESETYEMLSKDFEFIQEEQNDDEIKKISKHEYTKYIKSKVEAAAFQEYLQKKLVCKKNLKK